MIRQLCNGTIVVYIVFQLLSPPSLTLPAMPPTNLISLWRRVACILYDLLTLVAIWWAFSLPFAMVDLTVPGSLERLLYQAYLSAIGFAYFILCWRTRGATVGMRAWGVHIETLNGRRVAWGLATVRALGAVLSWACLGLGFLWGAFSGNRLCWHDRWSTTRLVSTD